MGSGLVTTAPNGLFKGLLKNNNLGLQNGLIKGSFGICAEVADFQRRVIANGGNRFTEQELVALNRLVVSLITYKLWDKIIAFYPLVAGNGGNGSLNSFAVNLKSSSFTLTNTSVTNAMCTKFGYQGNGSSFWNTGINANTFFGSHNSRIAIHCIRNINSSSIVDIGCTNGSNAFRVLLNFSTNGTLFDRFNTGIPGRVTYSFLRSNGYFQFNSITSSNANIFLNGDKVATNSSTDTGTCPSLNIFLGANNNNGSANLISTRPYQSFELSNSFTDTESRLMSLLMNRFNLDLGRCSIFV